MSEYFLLIAIQNKFFCVENITHYKSTGEWWVAKEWHQKVIEFSKQHVFAEIHDLVTKDELENKLDSVEDFLVEHQISFSSVGNRRMYMRMDSVSSREQHQSTQRAACERLLSHHSECAPRM